MPRHPHLLPTPTCAADSEENLVKALGVVRQKLFPTPVVLLETYPFMRRSDRWGKRKSSKAFSYHHAYARAAQLYGIPLFNVSKVFEEANVSDAVLWPHPPWEQHVMFAFVVAKMLGLLASCAPPACAPPDLQQTRSIGAKATADCDKKQSTQITAKYAHGTNRIRGGWKVTTQLASSAARTVVKGDSKGWRLYEDRPGKPGWISTVPGARIKFGIAVTHHPWLAYGLRRLRLHFGFMKTYKGGGSFAVEYCRTRLERITTTWNDTVSLLSHHTVVLPPCRRLDEFGKVEFVVVRGAGDGGPGSTGDEDGGASKVKITSVALCPA